MPWYVVRLIARRAVTAPISLIGCLLDSTVRSPCEHDYPTYNDTVGNRRCHNCFRQRAESTTPVVD